MKTGEAWSFHRKSSQRPNLLYLRKELMNKTLSSPKDSLMCGIWPNWSSFSPINDSHLASFPKFLSENPDLRDLILSRRGFLNSWIWRRPWSHLLLYHISLQFLVIYWIKSETKVWRPFSHWKEYSALAKLLLVSTNHRFTGITQSIILDVEVSRTNWQSRWIHKYWRHYFKRIKNFSLKTVFSRNKPSSSS